MAKRTLDSFFNPVQKKARVSLTASSEPTSNHPTYPFPVPQLPTEILESLGFSPASDAIIINDQPDLDLLYFKPYIGDMSKALFEFLRSELFFYRVQYKIKRGAIETQINTPRYTTVFGVDDSSRFSNNGTLIDSVSKKPIPKDRYKCAPRPLPSCLDYLREITEGSTGETYNFCLVNYYANGEDSISYHSDDERFLGSNPAIASFTLGAKRDFLMKHKPMPPSETQPTPAESKPLKLELGSGDMLLMRGATQGKWLHSVPKRKGGDAGLGRINITFRKAMVRGGTENYYRYNVGDGGAYRWDGDVKKMVAWEKTGKVEKVED